MDRDPDHPGRAFRPVELDPQHPGRLESLALLGDGRIEAGVTHRGMAAPQIVISQGDKVRRRPVQDSPRHQRSGEAACQHARQEAGQDALRGAGGKPEPHAHRAPRQPDQGTEHDPISLQAHVPAPEPCFIVASPHDPRSPAGS